VDLPAFLPTLVSRVERDVVQVEVEDPERGGEGRAFAGSGSDGLFEIRVGGEYC
jgi:hypothetical protein